MQSPRAEASHEDLYPSQQKPYPLEKFAHIINILRESEDPLNYKPPESNQTLSNEFQEEEDYFRHSALLNKNINIAAAYCEQAAHREAIEVEWTYYENKTSARSLSPPPELGGSVDEGEPEALALATISTPAPTPPPKPPDQGEEAVVWPIPRSNI